MFNFGKIMRWGSHITFTCVIAGKHKECNFLLTYNFDSGLVVLSTAYVQKNGKKTSIQWTLSSQISLSSKKIVFGQK